MKEAKPYNIEFRFIPHQGKVSWGWTRCQLELDDAGKVVKLKGTVQEITERKQAELSLLESEEKFHSLFDTMNEGVALHELVLDELGNPTDYVILDVNPAFEVNNWYFTGAGIKSKSFNPIWRDSGTISGKVFKRCHNTDSDKIRGLLPPP